jgi:hypothetical protein
VLLQVVALAGDVRRHFDPVRQADTRDFTQRRVRLFGRLRINAGADSAPLRRSLQRRGGRLIPRCGATLPYQLTECRQTKLLANPNRFCSRPGPRPDPHDHPDAQASEPAKSQPDPLLPQLQSQTRIPTVAARNFPPAFQQAQKLANSVSLIPAHIVHQGGRCRRRQCDPILLRPCPAYPAGTSQNPRTDYFLAASVILFRLSLSLLRSIRKNKHTRGTF